MIVSNEGAGGSQMVSPPHWRLGSTDQRVAIITSSRNRLLLDHLDDQPVLRVAHIDNPRTCIRPLIDGDEFAHLLQRPGAMALT